MKKHSKTSKPPASKRAEYVPPAVAFVPKNIIGPKVKELREKAGLLQKDLATRLTEKGAPLDRVQMNRLEMQKRFVSDVELVAIAAILGISPHGLLGVDHSGSQAKPATNATAAGDAPDSVPVSSQEGGASQAR